MSRTTEKDLKLDETGRDSQEAKKQIERRRGK